MQGSLRTTPQNIAAIGLTVDGREITEKDIDDIVETYNAEFYGARINLDHYGNWGNWAAQDLGIELNGCMLGDVVSVAKGKASDGTTVLTAILCPNESLLKLNQADQAVYYSIEIERDFMKTGKTYLTGLAMTDYPASTRTTRAAFSAEEQNKQVSRFALEIEQAQEKGLFKNLFSNIFANKKDDEMNKPELVSAISEALAGPLEKFSDALAKNTDNITALAEKFNAATVDDNVVTNDEATEDNTQAQDFKKLEEQNNSLKTQLDELTAAFAKAKVTPADNTTVTDDEQTDEFSTQKPML